MAGKREVVGVVRRDKLDKGVVVAVERRVRNVSYGKIQRRTSMFMAHDENNECTLGDTVEIVETRPMSKVKRWKVARIIQKSDLADIQPGEIATDVSE